MQFYSNLNENISGSNESRVANNIVVIKLNNILLFMIIVIIITVSLDQRVFVIKLLMIRILY